VRGIRSFRKAVEEGWHGAGCRAKRCPPFGG
jgi:hypothetical protein